MDDKRERIVAADGAGEAERHPAHAWGPAASQSEIEIRGLSKVYGSGTEEVRALDDVGLDIARGEFFTLLGPSGCGKTTLLRLIAGFERPTRGALRIGGREVAALPPNKRPVNTVFQSYALFPHMTVAENVAFGPRMLGLPRHEVEARTAEMLRLVRLEALAARRPAAISGGQQQRVALARALAPRPRVLLLDEPLSALDLKLRKEMQGELKRLQAETGITFVFVTHDQEEALTMSDRIAVMESGRILQVGSPRDIYDRPAVRFVADFIGETNFLDATVVRPVGAGAVVRLPSGAVVAATMPGGMSPVAGERVTVVVRPEHAAIAEEGVLAGQVESTVFVGTDTHIHLRLKSGEPFTVRRQNAAGEEGPQPEEEVLVQIAEGGVRVLRP